MNGTHIQNEILTKFFLLNSIDSHIRFIFLREQQRTLFLSFELFLTYVYVYFVTRHSPRMDSRRCRQTIEWQLTCARCA